MEEGPEEMEAGDEAKLCSLYGSQSRFVNFTNGTGRVVMLTSRLQLDRLRGQAWSTSRFLPPRSSCSWRFLGDDLAGPALAALSLLPDPWSLARENTYLWTCTFVDTAETQPVTFDGTQGPLDLQSLEELGPGETAGVVLRREGMASLATLCLDRIVTEFGGFVEGLDSTDLPSVLKQQLLNLSRDYEEMKQKQPEACSSCQEIHL